MNKNILIAEDEEFIANLYKLNLERHGVDVDIVADGAAAIEAVDVRQPDVLLLDLLMPNKDGYQVLEHIRQKGYTFPVIILTNLSQDIDRRKCEDLGVKGYLVKSDLTVEELWTKLSVLL
ncbi:MAG: response regulator [Candidatus Peribacteraceae bacterium]|nr:response regulator [Candidatus Peribacteraceae bacterium]